ncbi:AAA family ATPase [Cyclobacterium sp. SYSU L10401]|uniref:AAA family ATPase n=1 Tax=Cyclobacterium sp. SYSU L10401 TaxID=2678657 RepID=UPI0013D77091|nr:AAA family ATPase [Cyclobacterium sp. SYSU L10401]
MKIQKVTIDKYKAFREPETLHISGKNTFIYGENGSGKSSFYYALKDFFQSSVEDIPMAELRNIFLNDGLHDCEIVVEFEDNIRKTLNDRAKDTNVPQIKDANRLKSFLTYKSLLSVHNVKLGEKIDVFDLIIKGVLKHYKSQTITGGVELGVLWEELEEESKQNYGSGQKYYRKSKKKWHVEQKAKAFNDVLNKLFLDSSADYIGGDVNTMLQVMMPDLVIKFTRHTVVVNDWGYISGGAILISTDFEGWNIDQLNPQFILNEARLSAIAISIFLGVIKKQENYSPDLKPLFLDDILIGLDNENRIKLLEILKTHFTGFQIFLSTYDRHWYEVAKVELDNGTWNFIEFYKGDDKPAIFQEQKPPIERAKVYYEACDFPAAANLLRKECEHQFRELLLKTHQVADGIKGLIKPPNLETLIDNLKKYYEKLGVVPPQELIGALYKFKRILFNPMSHHDIESPIYKNDLKDAFKVIEDLRQLQIPQRNLLIEKNLRFILEIPQLQYKGAFEVAENVYRVSHQGVDTISPIRFHIKVWKREGVLFASPTGSPPTSITDHDKLEKIKANPESLERLIAGIYNPLKRAEPTIEEFMKLISRDNITLLELIN